MDYKEEWFNDADFWRYFAPVMFDDKRWSEVTEVTDGVIRFAGLSFCGKAAFGGKSGGHGQRILDLCCGMGRITAELARRGFSATGVDITADLLETARDDADYEGLDIEYIKSDARAFRRPLFFDTAVNLYVSFGYFEDPADDLLMARNVFESLKSGGCFIIETLGKEIAVRDFTPGEWFEKAKFTVLTEYEVIDSWAALKNRWILIDSSPGKTPLRIEKTFTQRLYSAVELRDLLYNAGFSVVEIYGGWDERPYDQFADMLIAVGWKTDE